MKKLILSSVVIVMSLLSFGFAQKSSIEEWVLNPKDYYPSSTSDKEDSFTLIPADNWDGENAVKDVLNGTDSFVEKYKKEASKLSTAAQLNSGIVNFEGIMWFLVHLVRLLLDAAMVIGFLMIVYSGYIYASGVFTGNVTKGNNAIKNAVIGLLIVIFSYTIIKIVTAMFL